MADVLAGIRQKLQQSSEAGRAVRRLVDTGIIDLKDLGSGVQTAKLARVYGPQATMAIQGGRKYSDPACGRRRARDLDVQAGR